MTESTLLWTMCRPSSHLEIARTAHGLLQLGGRNTATSTTAFPNDTRCRPLLTVPHLDSRNTVHTKLSKPAVASLAVGRLHSWHPFRADGPEYVQTPVSS